MTRHNFRMKNQCRPPCGASAELPWCQVWIQLPQSHCWVPPRRLVTVSPPIPRPPQSLKVQGQPSCAFWCLGCLGCLVANAEECVAPVAQCCPFLWQFNALCIAIVALIVALYCLWWQFVLCQGAFCVTLLEAAEPAALLSSPNSAALCCNKYQLAQLPPCPQLREARAPILDCNKVQQGATAVETWMILKRFESLSCLSLFVIFSTLQPAFHTMQRWPCLSHVFPMFFLHFHNTMHHDASRCHTCGHTYATQLWTLSLHVQVNKVSHFGERMVKCLGTNFRNCTQSVTTCYKKFI